MEQPPPSIKPNFSIVRDDLWYRVQRALRLMPANGKDGVVRRIIIFIILAWLPIVIWAIATGHAFDSSTGEPLLRHYGVHVRFLIALPALILGERLAHSAMRRLMPRFVTMGCVPEDKIPAFRGIIEKMVRLRNSTLPWAAIIIVILLTSLLPESGHDAEELSWAREQGRLGFGGWWFLCFSRPLFQIYLFSWFWRIGLVALLLKRIAGLGLDLVPNHADKMGGLGFITGFPRLFAPAAFAISCVLASKWAHEVAWHGAHIRQFHLMGGIALAGILLISVAPLLLFLPVLKRAKRKALSEYGQLIAHHGRLVRRRWLENESVADRSLLEAPELGPSCDINSIYESVKAMRVFPVTKSCVLMVMLPAAVPMVALMSMEIPLMELIGDIFKTLL